jgi:predicted DNA-binding transcriptional regulator YafY
LPRRRRFGVSRRSFHRDLSVVRQAGFYLETASPGDYRMVCFMRDFDGV